MFLPLAHVFARFISVLAVAAGVTVAHTPDIKNLLPDLQSYQPTFILAVPRVFEKVYNSATDQGGGRRQGRDFPPGRRHRHRLLQGPAGRHRWAWG